MPLPTRPGRPIAVLCLSLLATAATASAQPQGFWDGWFERSEAAKASQPHWLTPLATTTPRLEQEVRWDFVGQTRPDNSTTASYGGGKGLELIPSERVEVIVGLPAYVVHSSAPAQNGFSDWRVLAKYRLLSRDEEHGTAIVTAFLDVSVPTGTRGNGAPHPVITPTIAYGKGLGRLDVQGTFGASLPAADAVAIGRTYQSNTAVQYHVLPKIWPEIELNATWFQEGRNDGRHQVFVTPGVVIGRLPLTGRLGLTVGAGVQLAVSDFRTSNHNVIVSVRLPF